MERTIVVGDLHGCLAELEALLALVDFRAGVDRLISVGDLVGKGPHGAEVVRFFRRNEHEAVRGNHDHKLIAWRRGESKKALGREHRLDAQRLSKGDWQWLMGLPLYLRLPEHEAIVVHAGLVPGVELEAQRPEDLMKLRSIRRDGSPSDRVDDGEPWAKSWRGPELVIFGHDALRGLQRWPYGIGLDTGCVYGGELSALVLPERRIVSVRAGRSYAERATVQA